MKQIKFLGSAGEVTGSSYLTTSDTGVEILVDLGLFQGTEEIERQNYLPLSFNPFEVDGVFLTHGHLDHCGRLPLLSKNGFRGPIFMTKATKDLVELQLRDSVRIAKRDKDKIALFSEKDVERTLQLIQTTEYNHIIDFKELQVMFQDAGHILGSSSILVEDTNATNIRKLIFSGDLGNSPSEILQPTFYFPEADAVVMETTYGDKLHPIDNHSEMIQREFNSIEENGGTLLIPAFSLDRTQHLLHTINHLKKSGKIKNETPVYMDSPMATRATKIYLDYPNLFSDELKEHVKREDPFSFPGIVVVDKGWQSQEIVEDVRAKVIIAGNGMMEGGRIMHHASIFLPRETTRLLIVGYQGEDTIGRKIQEGAQKVTIDGVEITVRATISDASTMSAHADQNQLLKWVKSIHNIKQLFLTHGDENVRPVFKERVHKELGLEKILTPHKDEEIILG